MTASVVSAREAARMIGRNERTVRRWIEKGTLQGAYRDQTSGEFRVPVSALKSLLPDQLEQSDGSTVDTNTGEVMLPSTAADRHELAVMAAALESPSWIERAVRAETTLLVLGRLVDQVDLSAPSQVRSLVEAARAILGEKL